MLTLHIDSHPAVVGRDTRFRLTRENPLFTSSGDFTLEIALPLAHCPENQAIFGPIHRPEVERRTWVGRRLPFRLTAHPLSVAGILLVLGTTETEVKVQLLGGRSALNAATLDADGRDLYIDELPLGLAYEKEFAARRPGQEQTLRATMEMMYRTEGAERLRYGPIEETSACCFPILSTTEKTVANAAAVVGWRSIGGTLRTLPSWPLDHATTALPPAETARIDPGNVLAPQPYLADIIERIVRVLGLRLDPADNEIRTTWMRSIFIANVRATLELRHLLPHWTVRDFFEQVQHFFGVVLEMEEERVRIVRKKNRYQTGSGNNMVELKDVLDAYTTELEQGERPTNLFTGNVGYKTADINPLLAIPEEVYARARLAPFTTELEETTPTYERAHSNLLYTYTPYEKRAWVEVQDVGWRLEPVDSMGPLIRRPDRKIDLELKIVPVQMNAEPAGWKNQPFLLQIFKNNLDKVSGLEEERTAYAPIMAVADSRTVPDIEPYSIGTALREKKQVTALEKRDILEVALNPGTHRIKPFAPTDATAFPLAVGNPYVVHSTGWVELWSPQLAFVLNYNGVGTWTSQWYGLEVEGLKPDNSFGVGLFYHTPPESIQETAFSSPLAAETASKWTIDFADPGNFNPSDIYLIRGRRFLCEKIELTLTASGLDPIKRGSFYEVE